MYGHLNCEGSNAIIILSQGFRGPLDSGGLSRCRPLECFDRILDSFARGPFEKWLMPILIFRPDP